MQTVLSTLLLDAARAALIWLALLGVVSLAIAGLVLRPHRIRHGVAGRIRRAAFPIRGRLDAEARELTRYADEVSVAAERAATTARRRREEWLAAQEVTESAWEAYDAAEADVRRLAAAAALRVPRTPRTPAEYVDRERYLHRAALRAYRRKELSVEQFIEVLADGDGWDPRRHPVEQELVLRRVVRDGLLVRQRAAAGRERAAWRETDVAAVAARSLRREAFAAAERGHAARQQVAPLPPRGAPAAVIPRPRAASRPEPQPTGPKTRLA
jgi:hypothetical protein